jgi:hypothetical protein
MKYRIIDKYKFYCFFYSIRKINYNRLITFAIRNSILTKVKSILQSQNQLKQLLNLLLKFYRRLWKEVLHAIGMFFYKTKASNAINHDILLDKLDSFL